MTAKYIRSELFLYCELPEQEQEKRRNQSREVRIDKQNENSAETGNDSGHCSLARAQLLTNALENQHIRIDTHTDCQNDARDPG